MACARYGLAATTVDVTLQWNASVAAAVSTSLSRTFVGYTGCCAPALWCRSGSTSCTSFAPSSVYQNYGWTLDLTLTPVYTCKNTTTTTLPPAPALGSVSPVVVTSAVAKLTIEGVGLGNTSDGVLVQVGDSYCTSVTMCHRFCSVCTAAADCGGTGSGMACVLIGNATRAHCVATCSATKPCDCGATCVSATGSQSGVCLNSDYASHGPCNATSAAAQFMPSPGSGYDSRVQCSLRYPLSSSCGSRGPLALGYTLGVSPAPSQLSLSSNVSECSSDADCGTTTLCTVPKCVDGCCSYVPTRRCDTEPRNAAGTTGAIDGKVYTLLSSESAALLALPYLSTAAGVPS